MDRDLNEPIPNITAKLPIDIAVLKPDEIQELDAFCERNYPTLTSTEIRNRLNSGQLCFVARYNGRIVHASWAAFEIFRMPFLRLRYRLQPDEAYLYDMHTEREFRNQHIARARVVWTFTYLRDIGYKRAISDTLAENKVSLASTEPLGFRLLGKVARIIVGPLQVTLYKPNPIDR
jgi:GNAT superfamily N-acetyltransferase